MKSKISMKSEQADKGNRVLRTKDVCSVLGISATTLWRWRQRGEFPQPGSVPGSSICGWRAAQVEAWVNQKFGSEDHGDGY